MLDNLKAALEATGLPFAAFAWSEAPAGDYGVFAPDGANDFEADNIHAERATEGTVDWFTRRYPASDVAAIEAALEGVSGVSWYLNSVQFESESGYIHFEWVVQETGTPAVARSLQYGVLDIDNGDVYAPFIANGRLCLQEV